MLELSLPFWALLLFGGGVALLMGEFLLPTHGVLGVIGIGSVAVGVGVCFTINQWLGLTVLVASMLAGPLLVRMAIRAWPRSPLGRRLVLPPIASKPADLAVKIGQDGVAVSALRPMGTCDFAGRRIEAICDCGVVEAGKRVQVVSVETDRITVRPMES